jgi:type IV pilus assembly protein PilM
MMRRLRTKRSPIGVDLSTSHCCAVQLAAAEGDAEVVNTLVMRRQDPDRPHDVAELRSFREALQRRGFIGRSIVAAMPDDQVITELQELPRRGSEAEQAELARMQLVSSLRCDPKDIEVAAWVLPTAARKGELVRVLAVASRRDDVLARLEMLVDAGFDVCGLDVGFLAARRACADELARGHHDATVLALDCDVARLVIVCDGTVVYERSLAEYGTKRLVRSLVKGMGIEDRSARLLLETVGLENGAGEVDPTIRADAIKRVSAYCDQIVGELRMSRQYLENEHGGRRVGTIVLAGGGAGIPGLGDRIADALGVEVRTFAAPLPEGERALWGEHARYLVTGAFGLARYPERWCA